MNHRELQATIQVVQSLVDALAGAQGATEGKAKQIQDAYRKGAHWLKEWQTGIQHENPPAGDAALRRALAHLIATASTVAEDTLRHKTGDCREYGNLDDSNGMMLDGALKDAVKALVQADDRALSSAHQTKQTSLSPDLPTFTPAPIPPGADACPNCAVRQGLGGCSTCTIRMHRGIDGMEDWIALAIWYIGEVPTTSEREHQHMEAARALLWWAKGHDEDLRIPGTPG